LAATRAARAAWQALIQIDLLRRHVHHQRAQGADVGVAGAGGDPAPQPHQGAQIVARHAALAGVKRRTAGTDQLGQQRRPYRQAHAYATAVSLQLRAGVALESNPLAGTEAEPPLARFDPRTATQLHPE